MLIVIVIIGILAAALIPRLLNARGRANDTARKADLQQIATVLVAYQIDNGSFPQCPLGLGNPCELKDIADELTKAGMSGLPTDPNTSRDFYGISDLHAHDGQFAYTTVKK
jgi:type II secretory pathway pseudopilin PulG